MKKGWRVVFPVLAALCLAFIFYNSLQGAGQSQARSKSVVKVVSESIESATQEKVGQVRRSKMNVLVRKIAHVTEYGAFAFFTVMSLFAFRGKTGLWSLTVLPLGAAVGGLDEFLQSFHKGRYPSPKDVWLDVEGTALGLVLALILAMVIASVLRRKKKYELALSVA